METFKKIVTLFVGRNRRTSTGNNEFFWRAMWTLASILLAAYASYLYFASVNAAYFGEPPPIQVLHVIKNDMEHHLSGQIPVPSACHGLTVTQRAVNNDHFQLIFTTWQEPSRTCEPLNESRSFNTIVFSPDIDVTFSALFDGEELPIHIVTRL